MAVRRGINITALLKTKTTVITPDLDPQLQVSCNSHVSAILRY